MALSVGINPNHKKIDDDALATYAVIVTKPKTFISSNIIVSRHGSC